MVVDSQWGPVMNNQPSTTFGKRGVSPARAVNPYTGRIEPQGGSQAYNPATGIDEGLRAYMNSVYNYMMMGFVLTGAVAWMVYTATVTTNPASAAKWSDGTLVAITSTEYLTSAGVMLWMTPIAYFVCFGPLALLLFTTTMWRNLSAGTAFAVFMAVAGLIGVSFSGLALTYTNGSIAQMFFATATGFGGLSLAGYTTKKDLSGWGSFLCMGLFAVIGAIIINMFINAPVMQFAISVMGVLVFAGFTAYDTQMIKEAYSDKLDDATRDSLAISGALNLYLDFINMFRFLLILFGSEED